MNIIDTLNAEEAIKALNESDYTIKHEHNHYSIYKDGSFICSASTRSEAEQDLQELIDADTVQLDEYQVSWIVLNKNDTYQRYQETVFAKSARDARNMITDLNARDIKAIKI